MYNDRTEMDGGNAMAGLAANDNRARAGGTAAWADPLVEDRTRWDQKYCKPEEGGFNPLGQLDGLDLRRKIARDNEIARQQVATAQSRSIVPVSPSTSGPPAIKTAPPPPPAARGASVAVWAKGKEIPPGGIGASFERLVKESTEPPLPPPAPPTMLEKQPSRAQMEWRVAADAIWSQRLEALQREADTAAQQERMALQAFEAFAQKRTGVLPPTAAGSPVSFPSLPRMSDKLSAPPSAAATPPGLPPQPPTPPPQETVMSQSPPPPPSLGGTGRGGGAPVPPRGGFASRAAPKTNPPSSPPKPEKQLPSNLKSGKAAGARTKLSSAEAAQGEEEMARKFAAKPPAQSKSATRVTAGPPQRPSSAHRVRMGAQPHHSGWQQLRPTT